MSQPNKSISEMQAEIRQLQQAMAITGVPDDERAIYEATIARIRAAIAAKQGPDTPAPAPAPVPTKHTAPPQSPPRRIPVSETMEEAVALDLQRAAASTPAPPDDKAGAIKTRVIAPTAVPKNHTLRSSIKAAHSPNPHNPVITITWDDGYQFTGDETAIRGRFTSTLRDTIALKYAQEKRYEKIWRWDTPWRCAGFYRALIHLNPAAPPTLADFGFIRPSDITRTIFDLITSAATIQETT